MIKVEQIRIGNYINSINYDFYEDHIFADGTYDLTVVDADVMSYLIGKYPTYTMLGFKPIKLNEEWILDFGFEDFTGLDYSLKISKNFQICLIPVSKGFYISIEKKDNSGWNSMTFKKIKYVHQLQNVCFELFGKELKKIR